MKECTKCNESKNLIDFGKDSTKKDGLNSWCKMCVNIYYQNNKEKHLKNTGKYYKDNKIKLNKQMKESYDSNKENHLERMKGWRDDNPNYFKEYAQENKEERYFYKRTKYKEDVNFRIKHLVRSRIWHALKKSAKRFKTIELLDCSIENYKIYLESKFKTPMTFENLGKVWEIDHIRPLSSFDLTIPEEQKKAFHYTNTQPLFKTTEIAESYGYLNEIGNRDKSDKVI